MTPRLFPIGYTHEWISSMLLSPSEPETMNVTLLTAPQPLRLGAGHDVTVLAAIGLPNDYVSVLALDVDGDYLAMPAVNLTGDMTAWEPSDAGAPEPPENETAIDKMHRLGRWLGSMYLVLPCGNS
jgi:hypothetical protein